MKRGVFLKIALMLVFSVFLYFPKLVKADGSHEGVEKVNEQPNNNKAFEKINNKTNNADATMPKENLNNNSINKRGYNQSTDTQCGNGDKEGTEECDDGNIVDGDGCSSDCLTEKCGDGVVNNNGMEECDDGNTVDGDGCENDCTLTPPPPPPEKKTDVPPPPPNVVLEGSGCVLQTVSATGSWLNLVIAAVFALPGLGLRIRRHKRF